MTREAKPPVQDGPDFVCIGAQKAGTTWLYDNLAIQPGIWLPPVKELHFFNTICANEELLGVEERSWTGLRERYSPLLQRPSPSVWRWLRRFYDEPRTTRWYRSLFPAGLVRGRLAGDITPAYSTLDERGVSLARRVLRPGARLLLLVRDPVDRVWSGLKMMYRWKGRDVQETDLDAFLAQMDHPTHRLRTDYPRMVRLWRAAFGDDFQVFLYDRLVAAPGDFLRAVGDHIGLEGTLDTSRLRRRSNRDPSSLPIPPELEAILRDRFLPQVEELAALVPGVEEAWLERGASSSS